MYNIPANTLFIGKQLIHLPSCHSTNAIAAEMLAEGKLTNGAVIITSEQTAGKGQRGNSWESQAGANLTFSVNIHPQIPIGQQFFLNIITSLAVSNLAAKYLGSDVRVKWPNDIYYQEKKICGILIQNIIKGAEISNAIIGIGLNVNQSVFAEPKAISMSMVCGQQFSLQIMLDELLEQLDFYAQQLQQGKFKELKSLYLANLYWLNDEHLFKSDELFHGTIKGINDNGFLHVKTNEGDRYFNFKEIEFVK